MNLNLLFNECKSIKIKCLFSLLRHLFFMMYEMLASRY